MVRFLALALSAVLLTGSVTWACGPGGGRSPGGGGGTVASSGVSAGRMLYGPGSDYYDVAVQQQMRQAYLQMAAMKAAADAREKQQKIDYRVARREREVAKLAESRAKRNGQSLPSKSSPAQPSLYSTASLR